MLTLGVALGVLDPVRLELRRIARERDRTVRDIGGLRAHAEQQMGKLVRQRRAIGRGTRD